MKTTAAGLVKYIHASPSPYHCVATSAGLLRDAGFIELDERSEWGTLRPGDRRFVLRDGTLIGWVMGAKAPAQSGFRFIGAHTDSPNLRLKPKPEYKKEGYLMWGVEVYGGVLLHTWLDRDLGVSGRVAVRGTEGIELRLLRIDEPIARIPNLAIHLNREIRTDGLKLNKQNHMPPMLGLFDEDDPRLLHRLVARHLAVEPQDVMGWDLMLHDVQPPTLGGVDQQFVFAPRLDNQGSCYTALEALLSLDEVPESTAGVALFDHEEVGSRSAHGADSVHLEYLLTRIERCASEKAAGGIERAAANSFLVSADMAHGVHPNYADRHEGNHKPTLNGGPVVKINTNQRYSTSGETAAIFRRACQDEGVAVQEFVNRTDLACGSTIGPISAGRLAIRSVDVGCAMLSMHSVREQTGSDDVDRMARVKARILRG